MLRGFAISTLVHASVLAMAMISWPQDGSECDKAIAKLRRENPGIRTIEIVMALPQCAATSDLPIDFEDVGLVSNVSELRKAPEPKEEAAQPEAVPDLPDTPPEAPPEESAPETALPVPDPRTKPEEVKKPEPKKEPEPKKPEPLIKKDPPKKPEPKKDDLDFLNDFESVLKDKRTERPRSTAASDRPVIGNSDRDRKGEGEATGNTASIAQALKRQIEECWNPIDDLPKEDQIIVEIRVLLEKDGSLKQAAELVSPKTRPVGRKGIAVDRALGAVRKCEALGRYNLPEEHYEIWKDVVVAIGPEPE
jgi:outer membrane biosynthesis protein TonB